MWNVARYPHQWDQRLMEMVFYHESCPEQLYYSYHKNEDKGQVSCFISILYGIITLNFSGLKIPSLKYIAPKKPFIHVE